MRPGPSGGVKEVGASTSLSNSEGGDSHDTRSPTRTASLDIDRDGDTAVTGGSARPGQTEDVPAAAAEGNRPPQSQPSSQSLSPDAPEQQPQQQEQSPLHQLPPPEPRAQPPPPPEPLLQTHDSTTKFTSSPGESRDGAGESRHRRDGDVDDAYSGSPRSPDGGTKQSGCSCCEKYRYYSYRWWNLSLTRARLSRGYNGLACQGVMVLLLLYTLFAPDIWVLASTPNEFDESLSTSLFLCFVVFTLDVMFSSTMEAGYFGVSFFFWADVVGTLYVYRVLVYELVLPHVLCTSLSQHCMLHPYT